MYPELKIWRFFPMRDSRYGPQSNSVYMRSADLIFIRSAEPVNRSERPVL